MTTAPEKSSKKFSDYVTTHCTTCRAGWTRKDEAGEMVIVCLLDREPVWGDMTSCDRFESNVAPAP
jgi:hypothetical protein